MKTWLKSNIVSLPVNCDTWVFRSNLSVFDAQLNEGLLSLTAVSVDLIKATCCNECELQLQAIKNCLEVIIRFWHHSLV